MAALTLIGIGLVLGETLRAHLFPETSRKRKLFSGSFVLFKLKLVLPHHEFQQVVVRAIVPPSEPAAELQIQGLYLAPESCTIRR